MFLVLGFACVLKKEGKERVQSWVGEGLGMTWELGKRESMIRIILYKTLFLN